MEYPGRGDPTSSSNTYLLSLSMSSTIRPFPFSEYHGFKSFSNGARGTPLSVSLTGFLPFVDVIISCCNACEHLCTKGRSLALPTFSKPSNRLMWPCELSITSEVRWVNSLSSSLSCCRLFGLEETPARVLSRSIRASASCSENRGFQGQRLGCRAVTHG